MTPQEIFDTVAKHLIAQGRPAAISRWNEPVCMYRTPSGEKCAFGVLIPDEHYDPSMECRSAVALIKAASHVTFACLRPFKKHVTLIRDLQAAHDDWAYAYSKDASEHMAYLRSALRSVARTHNLDPV